ncbi:hypothetical protein DRN44_00070 [Thermococci archaeon]|nr:MAG: hypothetical protein DRN44_00070 [Thermococci archaeon]
MSRIIRILSVFIFDSSSKFLILCILKLEYGGKKLLHISQILPIQVIILDNVEIKIWSLTQEGVA